MALFPFRFIRFVVASPYIAIIIRGLKNIALKRSMFAIQNKETEMINPNK